MTEITRYVNPPESIQRQIFSGPPIIINTGGGTVGGGGTGTGTGTLDDYFISASNYANINDAVLAGISTGKTLLVPPGTYTPSGPLTLTDPVRLKMMGAGNQRTTINQNALTGPWISTDQRIRELFIHGFTFNCPNGEVFRRSYSTNANTGGQWTCSIQYNVFNNQKTALSIQTPDTPHLEIKYNKFQATGNEGRGLVLRGNPTNSLVYHNVFISQLYSIIDYFDGGGYGRFDLNEFFCFANRPNIPITHVWFIPGDNNDGRGIEVLSHKHGGENDDPGDTPYLFAEANSLTDLTVAVPSKSKSTKELALLTIDNTTIATAGTGPAIVSYTPTLDRCEFDLKLFNINRPLIGGGKDTSGTDVLTAAEITGLQSKLTSAQTNQTSSKIEIQKTAAIAVGGQRVVYMASDGLRYASNDNATTRGMAIGITTGAVSASGQGAIRSTGEMTEPSWSWTVPGLVFLGQNGLLTQTSPGPPALFSQVIGRAIATDTIYIDIQPPISIG